MRRRRAESDLRKDVPWPCSDCPYVNQVLTDAEPILSDIDSMSDAKREAFRLAFRDAGIDSPPLSSEEVAQLLKERYDRCKGVLTFRLINDGYKYTVISCGSPTAPDSSDYPEGCSPPVTAYKRPLTDE